MNKYEAKSIVNAVDAFVNNTHRVCLQHADCNECPLNPLCPELLDLKRHIEKDFGEVLYL